jgi:transketolase
LREAFGEALVSAGQTWNNLHVFDAGTKNSTMSIMFEKEFPDRFLTLGINEPGMVGLATGIAMNRKPVVICDMSVFLHHALAQIRAAARQGDDIHMIIAATHTGIAVGPDGGSAHDTTDIGRMRLIPEFNVITPFDGNQVKQAMITALEKPGFYYLRLNRPPVPIITDPDEKFIIGKAKKFSDGNSVTILATGDRVYPAMLAAEELGEGYADVIGISTIEPLDEEAILESVKKTGRVVTVEDHMKFGGLYETIAGLLASKRPTIMRGVGLERKFTTSGMPDELATIYKIDVPSIIEACQTVGKD